MENLINILSDRLKQPLPGNASHARMMHGLKLQYPHPPGPDARKAAVLMLLYPDSGSWNTVFIRRKAKIGADAHRGQIGLPGGKREQADNSLMETAVRETEEEIGVPAGQVTVLGALSELFIPVSNFRVFPYVGFTEKRHKFVLQESEVDDVLPVSLDYLRNAEIIGKTHIKTPMGMVLRDVPYFDLYGNILWGATAMILSEFLDVLEGKSLSVEQS